MTLQSIQQDLRQANGENSDEVRVNALKAVKPENYRGVQAFALAVLALILSLGVFV